MAHARVVEEPEVMEFMVANGSTEGLQVVPPTRDRLAETVKAGGRVSSSILGTIAASGWTITTDCAANKRSHGWRQA